VKRKKPPMRSRQPGTGDTDTENHRKHTKSKAQRGLVTRRIVYASRQRPHARYQVLKVDVRNGTAIDMEYAAALVAVRTPLSLADIKIVRIEES
jgi:hypothetical protein